MSDISLSSKRSWLRGGVRIGADAHTDDDGAQRRLARLAVVAARRERVVIEAPAPDEDGFVAAGRGHPLPHVAGEIVDAEIASEIYSTAGDFDLLAKFYIPDDADIGHFVTERLQRLPGVKDTFTIIAFKAFSPDTAA